MVVASSPLLLYKRGMSKELKALKRAIAICGGQSALGRAVGKSQSHVWSWLNRSQRVPAHMAAPVEAATKGQVPRTELRPDVFGEAGT